MKSGNSYKAEIQRTLEMIFGADSVETEYRFHPVRRWRFDYAVPDSMIAVEYNGHGGFVREGGMSRHGSIIGMTRDAEKLNAAACFGWRVLQFTALHFSAQSRHKHNLKDVRTSIMDLIAQIQNENEMR